MGWQVARERARAYTKYKDALAERDSSPLEPTSAESARAVGQRKPKAEVETKGFKQLYICLR